MALKMIPQVLFDNLWLPVRAGIVHNKADKRELRLLYAETLHCILDIGCLVVSVAPHTDLIILWHIHLSVQIEFRNFHLTVCRNSQGFSPFYLSQASLFANGLSQILKTQDKP